MRIKHTKDNKQSSKNFLFRKSFSSIQLIAVFVLGLLVSGGAVYAATIIFNADQVGFDNTGTSLSSTDVQGALDELYQRAKILDNILDGIPTMQDFDKSSLTNRGDSAKLVDLRDGNVYTVKKLADGNVWMTENLRIIDQTISSEDSNLPSGETWTIPESTRYNRWSAQDTNAAYDNSTYGVYYSFYTATAGTGGTSLTSGNAPSSICPKGWRLPTGSSFGESSEVRTLISIYNSVALMQDEPNFTLSGRISENQLRDQDEEGFFWSSAVDGAKYAFILNLSNDVAVMSWNKQQGYSVRCVAI